MKMEEQTYFINYIKKHPIKTLFYIYGVALIAYQISKGLDLIITTRNLITATSPCRNMLSCPA